MRTLLRRAFFSKLRNRVNVITTLVEAPLLAAMIAMVLRYNENGTYDFAGAYHIPIYLFLAVTVAMFLGLTNSADDIIRDRVVLQRERNLRIRLPYYILAKTSTLCMFALIQCMLFLELTLANDCNPGVANGLLGITVQQAQELGLHVRRKQQSGYGSPRDEVHPLWSVENMN